MMVLMEFRLNKFPQVILKNVAENHILRSSGGRNAEFGVTLWVHAGSHLESFHRKGDSSARL